MCKNADCTIYRAFKRIFLTFRGAILCFFGAIMFIFAIRKFFLRNMCHCCRMVIFCRSQLVFRPNGRCPIFLSRFDSCFA